MRREIRPHGALAKLAKGQHGVVSYRQLRELGYAEATIARALAAGRLHRVHRGAYAVGHAGLSPHGRCLAAVLACGTEAMLSHESAAWLWGLMPRCPARPEITVPRRGHSNPGISIHHSTILETADMAFHEGIPVTAVPRTLLDLAARPRAKTVGRAVERAERLDLLDTMAVDSLLVRIGGHPGRGGLGEAMAIYRDIAFTRSQPERKLLDLVLKAGLPRPAMNTYVEGYEVDAYWDQERFAVEIDGYETHGTRAAFERDPVRQEALKLAGIDMVRITARRLEREPNQVVKRIGALLEQRRCEPEQR